MAAALAAPLFTTGLTGTVTAGGLLSTALTGFSLMKGIQSSQAAQYGYQSQAEGAKEQAFAENLRAKEEGNTRRERLLNALAAQNARAGASGVTGGTIEQMQLKSMEDYQRDQKQSDVMTESTLRGLERQRGSLKLSGKQAKSQGLLDMGMGLANIGFSMGAPQSSSPSLTPGSPEYWKAANRGDIKVRS